MEYAVQPLQQGVLKLFHDRNFEPNMEPNFTPHLILNVQNWELKLDLNTVSPSLRQTSERITWQVGHSASQARDEIGELER